MLDVAGLGPGTTDVRGRPSTCPPGVTLVGRQPARGRGSRSRPRRRRRRPPVATPSPAADHGPPVRHRRHPGRRQRRPQADAGLRPRPGDRPSARRARAARSLVGQDTRRSGDMFVAAITAGATSLGVDVHVVGVVPTPALAYLTRSGPFAAGIMVSASHNPADDNGLKVLDGDGLKLDDDVEDELEQLIWREGELGGVGNADLGRRVDAERARRGLRRPSPRPRRGRPRAPACGSSSTARTARAAWSARASSRRPGRASRPSTSSPTASTSTSAAARPIRPRWPRPSSARGADVGFALDGDADRLIAVDADGSGGRWRPGPGHPRPGPPGRGRAARRAGRVDPVQRRAAGGGRGGRRRGHPDARRRQVHPRRHAGLGGRCSAARSRATSSSWSTRRRATAWSRPSRSCGSWAAATPRWPSSPRRCPLLPQQQRAVRARHKDQWEGDPVLGRAIADATARLGGRGRVLVRPSGTEPALRVMVEGEDAALVTRAGRRARGPRGGATTLALVPSRCGASRPVGRGRRARHGGPDRDVRHRRLHRAPRGGPHPHRRASSGSNTAATTPPGIALVDDDGDLFVEKKAGKLANLTTAIADRTPHAAIGLAHTRWATHGRPERPQRPSPPGLHGRDHGHPQRDHRELPGAARRARGARPHADLRDRHRGARPPRRGGLRGRPGRRRPGGPRQGRGRLRHRGHAPRRGRPARRRPPGRARSSSGSARTRRSSPATSPPSSPTPTGSSSSRRATSPTSGRGA